MMTDDLNAKLNQICYRYEFMNIIKDVSLHLQPSIFDKSN